MIFRLILVLLKRGIQCNNHLHKMSYPKWNLALVANFNTPSQLGRIPPANTYIIIPSCHHVLSLHIILTLLNIDVIMKKNQLRVSHKTLPLSTDRSRSRGRTPIRLDPISSCWTPCILDIGSTTVADASIGSAMVPNHFSQLIGQMRGTSHVSWTTWVGWCKNTNRERIYHSAHNHT